MSLIVVTPPSAEPVSLEEAKAHLKVDHTDEDDFITTVITAALEYCEGFQARAYISQTLELTLDQFPSESSFKVPRPPLQSVASITYTDTDGTAAVMAATDYLVDTRSQPGRVALGYSKSWPSVTLQPVNGVVVRLTAGYATPFTADPDTDTLTVYGRTYANGDMVRLHNSGGALPAGLSMNTDYYVVNAAGSAVQLAASAGGAAVGITGAGTGTHFFGVVPAKVRQAMKLLIGHWYEHREGVLTGTISKQIELSVHALLWLDRAF